MTSATKTTNDVLNRIRNLEQRHDDLTQQRSEIDLQLSQIAFALSELRGVVANVGVPDEAQHTKPRLGKVDAVTEILKQYPEGLARRDIIQRALKLMGEFTPTTRTKKVLDQTIRNMQSRHIVVGEDGVFKLVR